MTSVPSLEGVVAWSLSESSTNMVLADSVSPLLSLLQKPWGYLMSVTRPVLTVMQKHHASQMDLTQSIFFFLNVRMKLIGCKQWGHHHHPNSTYPALESSAPEVDSSPASWSTSSSSSSSVVPDSSLEEE